MAVAAFYFDHDVSALTAANLHVLGHDVLTTPQVHQESARDEAQLLTAVDRERILVTHNGRDFLLLHRLWLRLAARWDTPEPHRGILVIPQRGSGLASWEPKAAAARISAFVSEQPSLVGAFYVWRRDRGWTLLT